MQLPRGDGDSAGVLTILQVLVTLQRYVKAYKMSYGIGREVQGEGSSRYEGGHGLDSADRRCVRSSTLAHLSGEFK